MEFQLHESVPIIDFAGADRKEVARQLASACSEWGFFQLVNHGISYRELTRVKELWKEVFYQPLEDKLKVRKGGSVTQGWSHPVHTAHFCGDNKVMKYDGVENFFFVQYPEVERMDEQYPAHPVEFKPTIMDYTQKVNDMLFEVLVMLTEELGVQDAEKVLKGAIPEYQLATRGNIYPAGDTDVICRAHSDPGFMSLLLSDDVPGLQIKRDGKWVSIDPIKGAFLVNAGDSLEMFSNGKYRSVEHQGLPHVEEERLTVATFISPSSRTEISPLRNILSEDNPPKFRKTTFGEFIGFFLREGRHGRNGVEAFRL